MRVGLADRYKAGLWTQVEITLLGGSEMLTGSVSAIVPDSDGVPGRVSTTADHPCQVLPGRETTVRLITRFGHVDSDLVAEFIVGGRVAARRKFETALSADSERFLPAIESQDLIVTLGATSLGVEEAGKLQGADASQRPVTARLEQIEQLPTEWSAYEGVDAVILSTSQPEVFRKLAANNARVQALEQWIQMGGRLVLCVGSQADEILAKDSPLRQFAPGRLDKMVTLRQMGALESYCGSSASVPQVEGKAAALRVPRLVDVRGTVEAHEADLPLVIRTPRGLGQIIFVAADLDQAPLSRWTDRPMLAAKLLDLPTTRSEEADENTALMHYGFNDLAGQLRSALDRFAGVQIVPFSLVAGLIVLYILMIGPGDYFFLRKLVRRMEWTWLTFPLIVVGVSVGAYFLAYYLKGNQLRVNQVDLVDVDAASEAVRGTSWMNVFSPRMESFAFSVQPQQPDGREARDARVWMAWMGLPGEALGGMNSRAGGSMLWGNEFGYAPNFSEMYGVPIQVWSTKSLTARWDGPCTLFPAADLTDHDQVLTGTITNTLDFPLSDCILAAGRSVYELGTLEPGGVARLDNMAKRSELKTLLTGRKVVRTETGQDYRQEATPYDPASIDVPYILRTMMFYDAAGGRRYTRMGNSYQSFVDLSTLLNCDRAILVAQARPHGEPRHGAQLLRDGQPIGSDNDTHVTIYRFVFPVKK